MTNDSHSPLMALRVLFVAAVVLALFGAVAKAASGSGGASPPTIAEEASDGH